MAVPIQQTMLALLLHGLLHPVTHAQLDGGHQALGNCAPVDFSSANLHYGQWTFTKPDLTQPDCKHHFHVTEANSASIPSTAQRGLPVCSLRRFTANAARQCLRGKHVVFVGDSVTLYQWRSLILLLETGHVPRPIIRTKYPKPLRGSMDACGGPVRCDDHGGPPNSSDRYENKYYRNADYDINVTLLGLFDTSSGHAPVGWRPDGSVHLGSDTPYEWRSTGFAGIAHIIRKWFGKVDYLQLNSGLWSGKLSPRKRWRGSDDPAGLASADIAHFNDLVRSPLGVPTWSTTTLAKSAVPKSAALEEALQDTVAQRLGPGYVAARALNWSILDRGGIALSVQRAVKGLGDESTLAGKLGQHSLELAMVDMLHFQGFINNEFNNVMLNLICDS